MSERGIQKASFDCIGNVYFFKSVVNTMVFYYSLCTFWYAYNILLKNEEGMIQETKGEHYLTVKILDFIAEKVVSEGYRILM